MTESRLPDQLCKARVNSGVKSAAKPPPGYGSPARAPRVTKRAATEPAVRLPTLAWQACVCAALVSSPAIAAAQQGTFVEGLSELTAAVAGTYGDEGARIGPALDKMTSGLAEWDRAIQAFEARLASESR